MKKKILQTSVKGKMGRAVQRERSTSHRGHEPEALRCRQTQPWPQFAHDDLTALPDHSVTHILRVWCVSVAAGAQVARQPGPPSPRTAWEPSRERLKIMKPHFLNVLFTVTPNPTLEVCFFVCTSVFILIWGDIAET